MHKFAIPAVFAGLLAAGMALAPAPAAAQSYERDRTDMFGRNDRLEMFGEGRRGWFEDRERGGRDEFERGYRLGRDDERGRNERHRTSRSDRGRHDSREREDGWFSGDRRSD